MKGHGGDSVILVLIVVLIILIPILKSLSKPEPNTLNDSVMTLARIVVKLANRPLESGLFVINERHGVYSAVFNHIDTYQMEGVLDSWYGLTPGEISFLMSHSQIERNTATIRIEIGHSDITYNAVMNLLASNKSLFSKIETARDGRKDFYFSRSDLRKRQ